MRANILYISDWHNAAAALEIKVVYLCLVFVVSIIVEEIISRLFLLRVFLGVLLVDSVKINKGIKKSVRYAGQQNKSPCRRFLVGN
jgi:hypothetical protein